MDAFSFANLSALAADPVVWAALATLIAMEVVLGIDNLIFISIVTNRLPVEQRDSARRCLDPAFGSARDGGIYRQAHHTSGQPVRPRLLVARSDPDCRWSVPDLEGDARDSSSGRS